MHCNSKFASVAPKVSVIEEKKCFFLYTVDFLKICKSYLFMVVSLNLFDTLLAAASFKFLFMSVFDAELKDIWKRITSKA